ncbi:MAG TPA: hypothetical protein VNM14_02695 [Planctomycetota bacterium]|jgi:hypothetical protein|nr:hypothetical protein [Planctomycetota bacterium]
MLHLAFLTASLVATLACQAAPGAAQAPEIKGELRDVPPQGKAAPSFLCEGTTNLPDGALLNAYLYYGQVNQGREIAKDTTTIKGGKFTQDFEPFPKSKKNLAGKYIARFRFDPNFQAQAMAFATINVDIVLQHGTPQDVERETKAIRDQLVGEIRAYAAMGDEVKAKIQELKDKPADAWQALFKSWVEKSSDIQRRNYPLKVPEYRVLNLDQVADGGLENLGGILISAAKHATLGEAETAREGLTRLRQTIDYLVDEIASPKLTEPGQILALIESARKLVKDALARPDDPVLPARRKFVEMNALLQKSLPEDVQANVLEIGTRAVSFFTALADKQANAKELHKELDETFDRLLAALRNRKGS